MCGRPHLRLSTASTAGTCLALCESDPDCARGSGSRCVYGDERSEAEGLGYCSEACSPLTAAGCPSGWNCVGQVDPDGAFTTCVRAGVRSAGETCTTVLDCEVGSVCVEGSARTECRRSCRVGASDCPVGSYCSNFAPELVIGDTEWGSCR